MITIQNDGAKIAGTNYFESEHARRGFFFLSPNAGHLRLLCPEVLLSDVLAAAMSSKEVIISRGKWAEAGGKISVELLFEDNSDMPYVLILLPDMCSGMPTPGKWGFGLWGPGPKLLHELPASVKKVDQIPTL